MAPIIMKTVIKFFILILAAYTAVQAYYYLTEKRQAGEAVDERGENSKYGDEDEGEAGTGITRITGGYAIKLPQDIQEQAGIRLTSLTSAQYRNEIHATGRVVELQPLLDLRARYHEIQGEQRIASTALEVARKEFERLQLLHKEAANISGRELQQARLTFETRAAEVQAAAVRLEDLRQQFLQGWGAEITDLFLGNSDLFTELGARKSVLLLVTVTDDRNHTDSGAAYVNVPGNREEAQEARYLAPAPATDNRTQGATYYYQVPAGNLRTGMNVDVWIPAGPEMQAGVFIPPAAVIWYADRPWVYVARDQDTFVRTGLRDYTVTRQGWFVTDGFHPGDLLVTAGAQMLLSQEFRWSIPDEDDNP